MDIKNIARKGIQEIKSSIGFLTIDEKRELVSLVRGKERQEVLTAIPECVQLCQELGNEEFFYTIKEIGDSSALELLSYASEEQMQFVFDIELWQGDSVKPDKVHKWLELLIESDVEKGVVFLKSISQNMLLAMFQYVLHVKTVPEGMDQMEANLPDFTLDGVYHLEFVCSDECEKSVIKILKTMIANERGTYGFIMETLDFQLESNLVENSYQERVRRLAYDGIPEFEEALSIYAPLDIDEIKSWKKTETHYEHAPSYPMAIEYDGNMFNAVFSSMDAEAQNRVRLELAVVANKIIVVDRMDFSRIEDMARALKKAVGLITIALQILSENDIEKASKVLDYGVPIGYLFRLGNNELRKVQASVIKLFPKSDKSDEKKSYTSMLGSPCKESIDGLLASYPIHCFEGKSKNFSELHELTTAREQVIYAESVIHLFSKIFPLDKKQITNIFNKCASPEEISDLDYSTLLMTLVGNILLYKKEAFTPIPEKDVLRVLKEVQKDRE